VNINNYEVADFFKQLSLLTKSELPLPNTLCQMAQDFRCGPLRKVIAELGDATSKGKTLSEAMLCYPESFKPFYIRMIALGEREGTLPEILAELSRISRLHYMLATMIRDIMLYPVITVSVALLILMFLCYVIIPEFSKIFYDLLPGDQLPYLTQAVFWIAGIVKNNIVVFIVLYIAYIVTVCWMFLNKGTANKVLLFLVRKFPFSEIVFYNFAMARMCTVWALMARRKVPVEDAFPVIAEVMDFPEVANALNRVAEKCGKGESPLQCLKAENNISRLLIMTIENSPENKLPDELDKLADLFRERGYYGYRRIGMAWEVMSIAAMVFVVGIVICFIFLPFIARMFRGW
jgi:type II secretory pathway component PulF